MTPGGQLEVAGLFAGIGGFELGFSRAGHTTKLLADSAPVARAVLGAHFPGAELVDDVREIDRLPRSTDVVCAGFPCQDLSSVGRKEGIEGTRSSLVSEVFRLLREDQVPWLVLENVPFILQLGRGAALRLIVDELRELGYRWAYRVLDTQAFGLPQRRRRWYLVASNRYDPRPVLLSGDVALGQTSRRPAHGFYWTEGMRALGWAVDAVPPIKGGSSIGVASPPAVLMPDRTVVTPDIRDAERLQGFAADWTLPAEEVARAGFRWQAVGNAVSVDVVEWVAARVGADLEFEEQEDPLLTVGDRWPNAAWSGDDAEIRASAAGPFPAWAKRPPLATFLEYPAKPLSARATAGFLKRTRKGSLRFQQGFIEAVEAHLARQLAPEALAA